jgi:hypothetical protein
MRSSRGAGGPTGGSGWSHKARHGFTEEVASASDIAASSGRSPPLIVIAL